MPNDQSAGDFFRRLPEEARHRFEVRWFSADGETAAKNHTKYVSLDGAWAYVGSQNLDGQSFADMEATYCYSPEKLAFGMSYTLHV